MPKILPKDRYIARVETCKFLSKYFGYQYILGKRKTDFTLTPPKHDSTKKAPNSAKLLLEHLMHPKRATIYEKCVKNHPKLRDLMIWQMQWLKSSLKAPSEYQEAVTSTQVVDSVRKRNDKSFKMWDNPIVSGRRVRKKVTRFTEEDSQNFYEHVQQQEEQRKVRRMQQREKQRLIRLAEKAEKKRKRDEEKAMRKMEQEKERQLRAKKKARQMMERALLRQERVQQKKINQRLIASRKAQRLVERIAYSNRTRIQDSSDEDVDFVSDDDVLLSPSESEVNMPTASSSAVSSAPSSSNSSLSPQKLPPSAISPASPAISPASPQKDKLRVDTNLLRKVQQMPRVVECVSFVWIASHYLRLNERDITLNGFEEGIVDPVSPDAGKVISLLMSRLVVPQHRRAIFTVSNNSKASSDDEEKDNDSDYDPGASFSVDTSVGANNHNLRSNARESLGLPYSWWGPHLVALVNSWYERYSAVKSQIKRANSPISDLSASTAAAVSAFAKSQIAMLDPTIEGNNTEDGKTNLKTMGSLSNYFIKDETKMKFMDNGGRRKQRRCKECAGCLRPDCGMCRYCVDMKKFGGSGVLRQACLLRKCENLSYGTLDRPNGGRGTAMWELGGEGNRISAYSCAIDDLRAAEDIAEYKDALSKLTRKQLYLEADWWKGHLDSMNADNPERLHLVFENDLDKTDDFCSPFAGGKTFLDLTLSKRVDVILAVCHFRLDRDVEAASEVRAYEAKELRDEPIAIDWKGENSI